MIQQSTIKKNDVIKVTNASAKRLEEIRLEENCYLRILVDNGGCSGFQYKFELDKRKNDDYVFGPNDCIIVDPISFEYCAGSTLDYHSDIIRSGFKITKNPKAEQGCSCGVSFAVKLD